ncbi:hypothetical protein GDO81_001541 [Engystomops pustulosus]|uniref:Secreted protein n=1 Tax=Engystomops pustulosus TaxID=76066 RepID=A0AAV7DDM5_ENGPU|nr:hypothetical protein GDO81_001541 [Engystomops pustulosus]
MQMQKHCLTLLRFLLNCNILIQSFASFLILHVSKHSREVFGSRKQFLHLALSKADLFSRMRVPAERLWVCLLAVQTMLPTCQ